MSQGSDAKLDGDFLAYLTFRSYLLCPVPSGTVGGLTQICISSPFSRILPASRF